MYTNWFTSAVSVTAGFGWRMATQMFVRRSPIRFVLSIATTLMSEGLKVKVGAWTSEQQQRQRSRIFSGIKITAKKTVKWMKQKRGRAESQLDVVHDIVALDAGMKYKMLAKRRLDAARTAFDAAAVELREAERGMKDAEKYFNSIRSQCKKMECSSDNAIADFVLVDYDEQSDGGETETHSEPPSAVDPNKGNALMLID